MLRRGLFASLLLLISLVVSTGASFALGQKVALVIGNSEYVSASRLANPVNDAQDISGSFKRLGFEVTTALNLSQNDMRSTVSAFLKGARGADVALVYYAGHGLQLAGRNYLVPVDARLENEADVRFETVDMADILTPLSAAARTTIVMLDACRNNPLAELMTAPSGGRSIDIGRGLARIDTGRGTLIAFAAAPGQVALDGTGRNSPFTTALLEHIEKPGLEIRQVLTRVRRDVEQLTNNAQTPWDNSSLSGDLFLASAQGLGVDQPLPAVPQENLNSTQNPAGIAWAAIISMTPGDRQQLALKSFLERFGDSPYAGAAEVMLSTYAPAPETLQETETAAIEPPAVAEPIESKLRKDTIRLNRTERRLLQKSLTALGFSTRGADGVWGPNTRAALSNWQASNGFDATGFIDLVQKGQILAAAAAIAKTDAAKEATSDKEVTRQFGDVPDKITLNMTLLTSRNRIVAANSGRQTFKRSWPVALKSGIGSLTIPSSISGRFGPMQVYVTIEGNDLTISGSLKSQERGRKNFSSTTKITNGAASGKIEVTFKEHLTFSVSNAN